MLDSYLPTRAGAEPESRDAATAEALVSAFSFLSSFVQKAIADAVAGQSTGSVPSSETPMSANVVADALLENGVELELQTPGAESALNSLNLQLPPACAALVLVAQCLNALLLAESEITQPPNSSKSVVLNRPPDVIENLLGEIMCRVQRRAGNSISHRVRV